MILIHIGKVGALQVLMVIVFRQGTLHFWPTEIEKVLNLWDLNNDDCPVIDCNMIDVNIKYILWKSQNITFSFIHFKQHRLQTPILVKANNYPVSVGGCCCWVVDSNVVVGKL